MRPPLPPTELQIVFEGLGVPVALQALMTPTRDALTMVAASMPTGRLTSTSYHLIQARTRPVGIMGA